MKKYEVKNIRNVCLVGHTGSGKTSVAEAILFNAGTTTRLGSVLDATSTFDFEPEEVKRQEAYWLREFEDEIPMLRLPVDFPRPAVQNFEGQAAMLLRSRG